MESNVSALFRAAKKNDDNSVKFILEGHPLFVHLKGRHGNTVLMVASNFSNYLALIRVQWTNL